MLRKFENGKKYFNYFKHACHHYFILENSQTRTLLALSLLPFIFTPTLLSKKRKLDATMNISLKPTKSDSYRCFFSNFEVINFY